MLSAFLFIILTIFFVSVIIYNMTFLSDESKNTIPLNVANALCIIYIVSGSYCMYSMMNSKRKIATVVGEPIKFGEDIGDLPVVSSPSIVDKRESSGTLESEGSFESLDLKENQKQELARIEKQRAFLDGEQKGIEMATPKRKAKGQRFDPNSKNL